MKRILVFIAMCTLIFVSCDGVRSPDPLPEPKPGVDRPLIEQATYSPNYLDGVGAFRVNCKASHYNFSDPILWPGKPMASHLHVFAGNTQTNWRSTSDSIRATGSSTCTGGTANRTAYWAPALVDTNGHDWTECHGVDPHADCQLIAAGGDPATATNCATNRWTRWCVDEDNAFQIYYKTGYRGVRSQDVVNFPVGLKMIAGTSTATGPQSASIAWWMCKPDNHGQQALAHTTIAATGCGPGQLLAQAVEFPQCWDGVNVDSPDHKSHMAYALGWPDLGCPSSHPVALPQITQWVHYRLPAGTDLADLRLASDMYDGPGGYSGHADWMNGWDPDVFQRVVDNCYQPGLDCQMNLLGDGTALGLN